MKTLLAIILLITLTSCKTYVQVFETESKNTISENNFYVFENDSLKITYDFWANRGVLKFSIYNKLDKPIYIDWRKSSFIYNNMKINYWEEKEFRRSNSSFYYSSSNYFGTIFGSGSQIESTVITKPERVTFIPPKSNFVKNQFYIVSNKQFMIRDYDNNKIINELKEGEMMNVLEKKFNLTESPFLFRNFLTISLYEDISDEFYVDNEFYVSKIQKMRILDFSKPLYDETRKPRVLKTDKQGRTLKYSPFQKSGSFYLVY